MANILNRPRRCDVGGAMLRFSRNTRLTRDKIMAKAEKFFGLEGEWLVEKDRSPCCVSFVGGGGYLVITIIEEQKMRVVDVETKEFDFQAKRFLELL